MASRKYELSAYTYSRRRTVAAFLRPDGGGSVEDAPKPLRALVPSVVLGVVTVAVFGAIGIVKPSAPKDWQTANAVIVDRQTTTRYVMLGGVLHPVLNIASARLLLQDKSTVVEVDDKVLTSPSVKRGATLGIPYAPDSLPTADEAAAPKTWAACDRQGDGGVDQKLFVLGRGQEAALNQRLSARQAFYVQGPDGARFLVDAGGTAHKLLRGSVSPAAVQAAKQSDDPWAYLATAAFGGTVQRPQPVTKEWLDALRPGDPISLQLPNLDGRFGQTVAVPGSGVPNRVGDVFHTSSTGLHYVVLKDGVHPVSAFTARLLDALHPGQPEQQVDALAVAGANERSPYAADLDWPTAAVEQANTGGVACAVYDGAQTGVGPAKYALWTGSSYPVAQAASGTAGVYVTPGTGLLYRAVSGTSTDSGAVDLLTDAGLRYPVPQNGGAQSRLGYGDLKQPLPVPQAWSALVPTGPALNPTAAGQPQGS
ncbi:type VII secretion protein EccB [Streptacidiphilus monticola]|uniref:Type VII secretion protein EccB n=1 Tax=Streptacidiphilus monticola TaxID=2161674 RepID=A0ABW1FY64_9ACTN